MTRPGSFLLGVFGCSALLVPQVVYAQLTVEQADALLNRIYQQRMTLSPPAERQKLLLAQRAWVAFKEKNDELLRALVSGGIITEETRQAVILSELNSRKAEIVIAFGRAGEPSQNFAEADRRLNEAYQSCLRALAPPEQIKLREVQRLWITLRDLSPGFASLITAHRAAELHQIVPNGTLTAQPPALARTPLEKADAVDPTTPDPFATGR